MMQVSDYLFLAADQADFWEGATVIMVGTLIILACMGVGYVLGYDRGRWAGHE